MFSRSGSVWKPHKLLVQEVCYDFRLEAMMISESELCVCVFFARLGIDVASGRQARD